MAYKVQTGEGIFTLGMFKNNLQGMISPNNLDPSNVDDDGYPKVGANMVTNYFFSIYYPSYLIGSSLKFVIKGTGVCSLQLSGSFSNVQVQVGGAAVSATGNAFNLFVSCNANVDWRVTFNFTSVPTSSTFYFLSGSGNFNGTLRNLIFCKTNSDGTVGGDELALLNATKPDDLWADEFVAKMLTIKPAVWRPMGLTNPNGGNIAQYKYIPKWKTGLYIQTGRYFGGAYCGGTSGTDAYTCNNQPDYDSSGVYKDGETIHVKFVNAGTVSVAKTLNVGVRGVVPIFGNGGAVYTAAIPANTIYTMSYDAVLGGFIANGTLLTSIIPYEMLAGLCNRVGMDYWMNFQGQVDNASVVQITQAIRDTLNSNLNAYFEYGNEIWNPGGPFPYTTLATNKGLALGFQLGSNRALYGWYALRYREIMGMVTAAWSPRSSLQLTRVSATQAFASPTQTETYRMLGADLASVAKGGVGNSTYVSYTGDADYTKTVASGGQGRPIDYIDAFSYATYYSGAQLANFDVNGYVGLNSTLTVTNAASSGATTILTTSVAHGYSTGHRVILGRTVFTGPWAALNSVNTNVTVLSSTTFSVPVDSSAFAAYSSNGGSVNRYANEMIGLIAAADNYALGTPTSIAAALDWVDGDVRQGTNYGSASTGGSANQTLTQLATLANGTGIYPQWNTLAAKYSLPVFLYEGAFEGMYPATSSMTLLGYDTSYGGPTGKIANLINGYKNDRRFYTLTKDQMKQFFASSQSVLWSWLGLAGPSQWATFTGDMWTPPYVSWDMMRLNDNGKRRIYW